MSSRLTTFALATLILLGFSAPTARAHLGSTKYLHVEVHVGGQPGDDRGPRDPAAGPLVRVSAAIETVDVAMQLGLSEDAPVAEVLAHAEEIEAWLVAGLTVRAGAESCAPRLLPPRAEQRDQRSFVHVDAAYRCPAGSPADSLLLRDDTVFPDDRQHEALVYLAGRDDGAAVLRGGHRELALGGAPPSSLELSRTFVWEGMLHFALGYDHVLFLLSLLLGVGLMARRPAGGGATAAARPWRDLVRELAWLVTAFTLGHSVTLALAALELVVLPSRPVEIAIAASIVAVALHTLVAPQRRRVLPLIAGGFGLVHGFGFSAVLREVGLPPGGTLLALVSFNVGIELAQLAFVALALWPLRQLATWSRYESVVVRGGSVAIALVAAYWVVERVMGG
ncbi:MAG: HupE/UreJ family protein [Myxococcales bacterium]|nr:HupE/UreJ family protein [Myxococcales bacterium]